MKFLKFVFNVFRIAGMALFLASLLCDMARYQELPEVPRKAESSAAKAESAAGKKESAAPKKETAPVKAENIRCPDPAEAVVPELKHGTAGFIGGKTVIITIMADDASSSWDASDTWNDDWAMVEQTRQMLISATDWITRQCTAYSCRAEFVCDWEKDRSLLYHVSFPEQLVRFDGSKCSYQADWLRRTFPREEVLRKYGADDVVYLFLFNTRFSNEARTWTHQWQPGYRDEYEFINDFVRFDQVTTDAASLAHEILHCFGAPDLYYTNEKIPSAYVQHCKTMNSQDILFSVNSGREITKAFTPVDAYYLGLTSRPYDALNWSLGLSEFDS